MKRVGAVETGERKKIMNSLRIGHRKLNSTLRIIGKHPTGFCDHCQTPGTVEHVLVNCRKYDTERENMTKHSTEEEEEEAFLSRLEQNSARLTLF